MKKILIIVCTLFIVITIGTYSFNFIKYKEESFEREDTCDL